MEDDVYIRLRDPILAAMTGAGYRFKGTGSWISDGRYFRALRFERGDELMVVQIEVPGPAARVAPSPVAPPTAGS